MPVDLCCILILKNANIEHLKKNQEHNGNERLAQLGMGIRLTRF